MGRLFSSSWITVGTAAALSGFDYRFGTFAACVQFSAVSSVQVLASTNNTTGACFWLGHVDTGGGFRCYDGSGNCDSGIDPVTGTPYVVVVSKATGTATPRFNVYRFSTNVWTSANGGTTQVNSAANTSLVLGAENSSGTNPLTATVFAVAAWPGYVMSDSEVRLLTAPNWGRLNPGLWDFWDTSRDNGDMLSTIGRYPMKQTARTGAARSTVAPPPGWGSMPVRHRR